MIDGVPMIADIDRNGINSCQIFTTGTSHHLHG